MLENKPEHQVPGNAKCLEGLERVTAQVKQGLISAIAIVKATHMGNESEYWGDENARAQIIAGCETLKYVIISSVAKLTYGEPDYSLSAYDIGVNPICYDVIPWLAQAVMILRSKNLPGPMRVCFTRSHNSMVTLDEGRTRFFERVIRPAMSLFGVVEDVAAAHGRFIDFMGLREVARLAAEGVQIPQIKPSELAMQIVAKKIGNKPPVTITLRETDYYAYRNSDTEQWLKFARWLEQHGENVIVVRDTRVAREKLDDAVTFPAASEDLHVRAALYLQAKCNMFVQNGPWSLAQFSNVPWLCFATIAQDCPEECNRPDWWQKFMGLNGNKQIVWATDKQRIVYRRDTFDNMRAAWEELAL